MQLLGLVAAAALFVVSVLIGSIVLAALVGFALLLAIVIYLRLWWLGRRFRAAAAERDRTVEAEYRVIDISEPGREGRDQDPDV